MIVHCTYRKLTNSPPCIPLVSRVESMSILGVQFNQVLSLGSQDKLYSGKGRKVYVRTEINQEARSCGARYMRRYTRATLVSQLQ